MLLKFKGRDEFVHWSWDAKLFEEILSRGGECFLAVSDTEGGPVKEVSIHELEVFVPVAMEVGA